MDDNNDLAVAVGCLAASLGAVALIVAGALLEGWALRLLWGWHLTPVVHIAAPPIATCIGIAAIAGMLQSSPASSDEEANGGRALALLFVRPLLLLFVGWLAYRLG